MKPRVSRYPAALIAVICLFSALVFASAKADDYGAVPAAAGYEELAAALPTAIGSGTPAVRLTADLRLEPGQDIDALGTIVVPEGVTLTIESDVSAALDIRSGGTVIVASGGALRAAMGSRILVSGSLAVLPGALMESASGGTIEIPEGGTLLLGGLLAVGSSYDPASNTHEVSLSSAGSILSYDIGSSTHPGHIVVKPVEVIGGGSESVAERITAAGILNGQISGKNELPVYVTARSFDELEVLSESSEVNAIYVLGTPNGELGMDLMRSDDESAKAVGEMHVVRDLILKKPLCLDWVDLIVDHGHTVSIPKLSELSFASRRTRIVVEGPDASGSAGGTIDVAGVPVISGAVRAGAVFTVTSNIMALGAAEWAVGDYPASAVSGGWYYVHEAHGVAEAKGVLNDETVLPLIVEGTLRITGDFTHPGSVEIRNDLWTLKSAVVKISYMTYGVESIEKSATLRGMKGTTYDLVFDLNSGAGDDDLFDHLNANDNGQIYLAADGNSVPDPPERPGYTFTGWEPYTNWYRAGTEDNLRAFHVRGSGDQARVPVPKEFPVIMQAQWEKDPEDPGATNYVRRAYEVILGRSAGDEEIAHWVDLLHSGTSAGEIISEFFRSDEYGNQGNSDRETVQLCYRAMLGREADDAGIDNWIDLLEDGYSTTRLVAEFVASPEFRALCSEYGLTAGAITLPPRDQNSNITRFIERCYTYSLGRDADEGGLNEWCAHLVEQDLTPERVAFGFIFSDEARRRNLDDEAFIDMLYRMMLDRRPDTGYQNWLEMLRANTEAEIAWAYASGERSEDEARDQARQNLYAEFAKSEEFALMIANYGF